MSRLADARTIARILATRVRIERLLRDLPLDDCVRALDVPAPPTRATQSVDPDELARIAKWTGRLLRNRQRPRTTCLHRALTRFALLRRAGASPRVILGVGTGALEGHAWVELYDAPWLESDLSGLAATFEYPPRASDS